VRLVCFNITITAKKDFHKIITIFYGKYKTSEEQRTSFPIDKNRILDSYQQMQINVW